LEGHPGGVMSVKFGLVPQFKGLYVSLGWFHIKVCM
jgi:hypothetical protein